MEILRPGTAEELAGALRECASASRAISLGGAFSKDGLGGPGAPADVTISTTALNRVRLYEPRDLTISVEAGLEWAELTRLVAGQRQMIPLDPPWAARGTVGGVVAANLSGPRRRLYGTARDMVIGMRFATLEGKLVDSGGMVVKNVAGLDMAKLLIGSFGTLAAIVVVNFRVTPAPPATRTFVRSFDSPGEVAAARDRVIQGVLQPAAVEVLNPAAAARAGLAGYSLLVAAGGSPAVLERYARELEGAAAIEGQAECELWDAVREFVPRFMEEHPAGAVLRFSHTLTQLAGLLEKLDVPVVARAGSGVAYAAFSSAADAAAALAASPLAGVVECAPRAAPAGLTLWPSPGSDFAIMEKVKATFDPQRLLNRGRLYGRI